MNASVIEITGLLRTDFEWPQTGPTIEGTNIVEMVARRFGNSMALTVTVGVHIVGSGVIDEVAKGDQGYSELTDYILDRMVVGGIDLLNELEQFNNQRVTLRVDQGPMTSRRHTWGSRSLSFAEELEIGNLDGKGFAPLGTGPTFSYNSDVYANESLVDRLFKTFLPDDNGDYARLNVIIDGKVVASGTTQLTRRIANDQNTASASSFETPDRNQPPLQADGFVVDGVDILKLIQGDGEEQFYVWIDMEVDDKLEAAFSDDEH